MHAFQIILLEESSCTSLVVTCKSGKNWLWQQQQTY